MVSVVPLTIVGGLFMIAAHLPVSGWESRVAPYRPLLQIPVTATFGLLAVVACFSIAYDLGRRQKQDAMQSALMATVAFLLIQIDVERADAGDRQPWVEGALHRDPRRARLRPRPEILH